MFLRVRVCSERQVQLSDNATQRRAVLFARTGETIHLSWRARTDLRLSSSLISAHAAKPFICLGAWLGGFVQAPWWAQSSGIVHAPWRTRMDEIVLLSWSVDGWVCSCTLAGADKWDRSGTLAGADRLALKLVLDLGTCLRELFLCFGNLYAVEDALQAVFAIEIADCLEADDGGHSAVCETLNGAVNEGGDRTAQEGDAAGGVAHCFHDGVADLQGAESVRNERIAHHCAEDLDELCVRGAETV